MLTRFLRWPEDLPFISPLHMGLQQQQQLMELLARYKSEDQAATLLLVERQLGSCGAADKAKAMAVARAAFMAASGSSAQEPAGEVANALRLSLRLAATDALLLAGQDISADTQLITRGGKQWLGKRATDAQVTIELSIAMCSSQASHTWRAADHLAAQRAQKSRARTSWGAQEVHGEDGGHHVKTENDTGVRLVQSRDGPWGMASGML